jgi:hypothetical protein
MWQASGRRVATRKIVPSAAITALLMGGRLGIGLAGGKLHHPATGTGTTAAIARPTGASARFTNLVEKLWPSVVSLRIAQGSPADQAG